MIEGDVGFATLLLGGQSAADVEEVARCVDDALGVAWTCRGGSRVVWGGGGFEAAIAIRLRAEGLRLR